MDSLAEFFKETENRTNILLSKALYFCVIVFLLLGGVCMFGLLPDIDTGIVLRVCFIGIVTLLILIPLLSIWRTSRVWKYILISVICLMNLSVACIPNMRVYLTFLLPPLISFFYANEKFTLFSSGISGLSYVLCIGVRCLLEGDDTFTKLTRTEYFFAFGFGGLVEFCFYCYILFFLTRTTSQLLKRTFLRKKRLNEIHNVIFDGFANIVESKDKNTGEHISRTSRYVKLICEQLLEKGIYPDEINETTIPVMIRAAPFHDLGKISVPDEILNKPYELDRKEWDVIHHHPADGALFIQHNFDVLNDDLFTKTASEMALCHHERMDGTGYPYKLVGDEIPVSARIMATADIFDALVSKRAYKEAYSIDEAYELLKKLSGTTLDPVMVDCMIDCREKVEQIMCGEPA